MNTTDKILVIIAVYLFLFINAMIVIFCIKSSVPDTLITCVLGSGGLEAIALAGIKISKIMKGQKIEESEEIDL